MSTNAPVSETPTPRASNGSQSSAPPRRRIGARLAQLVRGWDVFVSYSRADARAYAEGLQAALRRAGATAFLDTAELAAGDELTPRLRSAARRCDVMVTLVTPGATAAPKWLVAEHEAARASRLGPRFVPVAFAPARPGALGAAFATLDDHLGEAEAAACLASGTPSATVIAAVVRALGRQRLRRRRIAVAAIAVAMLGVLGGWQRHRLAASRRDLAAQRWSAHAEAAAATGRFDVAEYAATRALETGGGDRDRLRAAYHDYRAHRRLVPAAVVEIATEQTVVGARVAPAPVLAVADDRQLTLVGPGAPANPAAVACHGPAHPIACGGERFVACEGALITWTAADTIAADTIAGDAVDLRCAGATATALVAGAEGALTRMTRQSGHWRADGRLGDAGNAGGGLCVGTALGAWTAAVRDRQLVIERSIGGASERNEVPIAGLAFATVHADDGCARFFAEAAVEDTDPLARFGATRPAWALLDWDAPTAPRDLPADLVEVVGVPRDASIAGLARTSAGDLLVLPEIEALLRDLEPRHVARDVTDVLAWPGGAPRHLRTVSIERGDLVVRTDGALDARVPIRIADPVRLRAWPDAVVVEGIAAAQVFTPAKDGTGPASSSIALARTLGLSDADQALPTATAPR